MGDHDREDTNEDGDNDDNDDSQDHVTDHRLSEKYRKYLPHTL